MVSGEERPSYVRNPWIEALRVLSAFGIVWFHAGAPHAQIGLSGLVAFIVISTFLEARRDPGRPLDVAGLAKRLLLPWAVFYVLFAAVDVVRHRPFGLGGPLDWLLEGPSPHLWFLPFIFAVQLMIRGVRRAGLAAPLAAAAAILLVLAMTPPFGARLEHSLGENWIAVCPVMFGILLARSQASPAFALAVVAFLAGLMARWWLQPHSLWMPEAIGCAACAAAVALQGRAALPDPSRLSDLTFGVYLVHPLCLSAMAPLRHANVGLGAAAAFILALAAVWIIRRYGGPVGLMITGRGRPPRSGRFAAPQAALDCW